MATRAASNSSPCCALGDTSKAARTPALASQTAEKRLSIRVSSKLRRLLMQT
jgi:hypothetical protein